MLQSLTAASGRTNPAEVERMIAMAHARLAKREQRRRAKGGA